MSSLRRARTCWPPSPRAPRCTCSCKRSRPPHLRAARRSALREMQTTPVARASDAAYFAAWIRTSFATFLEAAARGHAHALLQSSAASCLLRASIVRRRSTRNRCSPRRNRAKFRCLVGSSHRGDDVRDGQDRVVAADDVRMQLWLARKYACAEGAGARGCGRQNSGRTMAQTLAAVAHERSPLRSNPRMSAERAAPTRFRCASSSGELAIHVHTCGGRRAASSPSSPSMFTGRAASRSRAAASVPLRATRCSPPRSEPSNRGSGRRSSGWSTR